MHNIKKYLEDLPLEYVKLVDKNFWELMGNQDKKCTCERTGDNVCDYCDEMQSIEILKKAKESYSNMKKIEEASAEYRRAYELKKIYDLRFEQALKSLNDALECTHFKKINKIK